MEELVEALADKFHEDVYIDFSNDELLKARKDFEGSLLVKLVGNRGIKKGIFIPLFKKLWGQKGGVTFSEVDNNVLMATFSNEDDKERVVNNGPWLHSGWAVLVTKWVAGKSLEEIFTNKIQLVVQVHNLPLELRSESIARKCAMAAGKVIGTVPISSLNNSDLCIIRRKFHRFKVEVDISKPLVPGCFLGKKDLNPPKAMFRYEKLPNVCLNCGLFDHETARCTNQIRQALIGYDNSIRADYMPDEGNHKESSASDKTENAIKPAVHCSEIITSTLIDSGTLMVTEKTPSYQLKGHGGLDPKETITQSINCATIIATPKLEEIITHNPKGKEKLTKKGHSQAITGTLFGPSGPISLGPPASVIGLGSVQKSKGTSLKAQTVEMKRKRKNSVAAKHIRTLPQAKLVEVKVPLPMVKLSMRKPPGKSMNCYQRQCPWTDTAYNDEYSSLELSWLRSTTLSSRFARPGVFFDVVLPSLGEEVYVCHMKMFSSRL